jgi:hypothetical protein
LSLSFERKYKLFALGLFIHFFKLLLYCDVFKHVTEKEKNSMAVELIRFYNPSTAARPTDRNLISIPKRRITEGLTPLQRYAVSKSQLCTKIYSNVYKV